MKPGQPPKRRKKPPIHPGEILQDIVLPHTAWGVDQVARYLGGDTSPRHLRRVLGAERPVTAEMAVRLGALFNTTPHLWMDMQTEYDMWQAKRSLRDELRRVRAAGKELDCRRANIK